jgi:ketosteroid isomerase-like protein
VAEGDSVVVFFSYRVYAKATGRAKEGDGVHLFHFLGGKIAALREFLDVTATPAYRADLLPEMTMNDPVHCKFCG